MARASRTRTGHPRTGHPQTAGDAYRRALSRLLAAPTRPKLGLTRMRALLAHLGDPQDLVPFLHIAGTKGKGSTAAFVDAILAEAGIRRGLTTSPHLTCARERISIDGAILDEETFVALEADVDAAAQRLKDAGDEPSFFERMIAMAFLAFSQRGVAVGIVEVGLGGRLDATNVIVPAACAVTRLGLDHTEILGSTLAAIAGEKAGIFKPGIEAVTVRQEPEAMAALERVAAAVGAPLTLVAIDEGLKPTLLGRHQRENASLAAALVRAAGLGVSEDAIARGVERAVIPGRYETVSRDPWVIVDGAHNETAALALVQTVQGDTRLAGLPVVLLVGLSEGHDAAAIASTLATLAPRAVVATRTAHPRARHAAEVARALARACGVVDEVKGIDDALDVAVARARALGGCVVATGSLFVAGAVRARFLDVPRDDVWPLF